jgi:hypothetical protein
MANSSPPSLTEVDAAIFSKLAYDPFTNGSPKLGANSGDTIPD